MAKIHYIDEAPIKNTHVLLRLDLNVSLNPNHTIADDVRIKQSLPTIKMLLENGNRIVIISHLGRPSGLEEKYSMAVVVERLKKYLPDHDIELAHTTAEIKKMREHVIVLENIRFFSKEKDYSKEFATELASLGSIYVNDAFGVCHRSDTSVIGPPKFIPGYGGLLLKKEVEMISKISENPERPLVTIIGGAKVSTKIGILEKLIKISDHILIGGGLANTFLSAQGKNIGESFAEYEAVQTAIKLLSMSKENRGRIVLPSDAIIANGDRTKVVTVKVDDIPAGMSILDIGPETMANFGNFIANAKTLVWNGPIGLFEEKPFRNGTDFIYYAITHNSGAISIVGGGDTLAAISKKEYLDNITHISTGGGAMLEYIEKGTLPGIEALKR